MSPSRIFILRPVGTSLLMAAILLVGWVSYRFLPISALPEVDYPTIQVQTFYPGASPEVMTSSVTAPLERQFGEMPGLNQMASTSSGGASVITLQFDLSLSLDIAEQEVQAEINAATSMLPADLPAYSWLYARDAAAGLLHLLDLSPGADPPHRVFNVCSGQPWGPRILDWCRALEAAFPGFAWRQSADPAEVTIRFSETRPRAPMSLDRIAATGWAPRYGPDAAYADYLSWVRAHADALR